MDFKIAATIGDLVGESRGLINLRYIIQDSNQFKPKTDFQRAIANLYACADKQEIEMLDKSIGKYINTRLSELEEEIRSLRLVVVPHEK